MILTCDLRFFTSSIISLITFFISFRRTWNCRQREMRMKYNLLHASRFYGTHVRILPGERDNDVYAFDLRLPVFGVQPLTSLIKSGMPVTKVAPFWLTSLVKVFTQYSVLLTSLFHSTITLITIFFLSIGADPFSGGNELEIPCCGRSEPSRCIMW